MLLVTCDKVLRQTGLAPFCHLLFRQRTSFFGRVAWLDDGAVANKALCLYVETSLRSGCIELS